MKVLLSDIAAAYGEPLYSVSRWKSRGLPILDPPALVERLANQHAGRVPPLVIRVASNPSILHQITAEIKSLTKTSNEVPHPRKHAPEKSPGIETIEADQEAAGRRAAI